MARLLVNPPQATLWKSNAIIAGNGGRHETDAFQGTLSVKSVISGRVTWRTPKGRYTANQNCYLVLNEGQTYNLKVDEPSRTFCVFFRPGFMEHVAGSLSARSDELLQDGILSPQGFSERLSPHDRIITPAMLQMQRAMDHELEQWEIDELFIELARTLLLSQRHARAEADSLSIAKASTRQEIHARLSVARDYMLANLTANMNLERVAREACLSPFHFHRLFREAFRCTPHEFVRSQRIRRAQALLLQTEGSLLEICIACGFESLASFCRLFKVCTGVTPTQYRLNRKIGQSQAMHDRAL